MRRFKNFRQFHSNRRQIVDIKKPAVINFFSRHPPKGQPVGLRVEQLIERVKAARVARFSIDLPQRFFDRLLHLRRLHTTTFQTTLDDFLLADALRDAPQIGLGALRQIFERGQDALEFGIKILLLILGEILPCDLQNISISARRDRQPAIVVGKIKSALFEADLELAPLKHAPVLIAQNREQNFAAQVRLERMPFDVEIRRVHRAGPIFEHIHPPLIKRLGDAHVVRHEIEQLSHSMRVQLGDPRIVLLARTDRRVEFIMIANFVAVQTLRPRLKIRRGIGVAHTERVQVRDDFACLRESKLPVKLQPVSATGDARMLLLCHVERSRDISYYSLLEAMRRKKM